MAPTNYYDRCNKYPKGGVVENPYHMPACIHYLVFYSSPHQWQLLFEGNLKYPNGSTHDKCSPKVRKGVEVSALKFLPHQYLRKVPQLNMASRAFLEINNKVGTITTVSALLAKSGS